MLVVFFTDSSGLHSKPPMYGEQLSVSFCAKTNQVALQFPVLSVFPRVNALRAVLLSCGSKRNVSCFCLICNIDCLNLFKRVGVLR